MAGSSINPHIFRAYDVRGLVGKDLTREVAERMGRGFGTLIQEISGKRVAVGGDNRESTVELKEAFVRGLRATGCDVVDIGLSSSPLLYFAVCHLKLDGGVNVTASHNPPEYNGFKFTEKNAFPVWGPALQRLRETMEEGSFAEGKGTVSDAEVFTAYAQEIAKKVSLEKELKVVVDCGNGATSPFAVDVLRGIGCEVEAMYCRLDGSFPNHPPDPAEEANLAALKERVLKAGADAGVAFDGDGDRLGVVDDRGRMVAADRVLMLLAADVLARHPKAVVVTEVKATQKLVDFVREKGGKPLMWKVGHSLIKEKMREEDALLGGEVSGHFFFRDDWPGFDDGIYAAARLLAWLSRQRKPLSAFVDALPKTVVTPELKAPCPDEKKFEVVEEVRKQFMKDYACVAVDGVRVLFDDSSWGLVRASNTNPYLTLRFEAPDTGRLREVKETVFAVLRRFPEVSLEGLAGDTIK